MKEFFLIFIFIFYEITFLSFSNSLIFFSLGGGAMSALGFSFLVFFWGGLIFLCGIVVDGGGRRAE